MEPLGVLPGRSSRSGRGDSARATAAGFAATLRAAGAGVRHSVRQLFVPLVFRASSENSRCAARAPASSLYTEFLWGTTRRGDFSTISRGGRRGGERAPSFGAATASAGTSSSPPWAAFRSRVVSRRGTGREYPTTLLGATEFAVSAVRRPKLARVRRNERPNSLGNRGRRRVGQGGSDSACHERPRRSRPGGELPDEPDAARRRQTAQVTDCARYLSQQRVLGEPSARVEAEPAVDGLAVLRGLEDRDPGAGLARRVQCRDGERPAEAASTLP